jgi:hypothetical protein
LSSFSVVSSFYSQICYSILKLRGLVSLAQSNKTIFAVLALLRYPEFDPPWFLFSLPQGTQPSLDSSIKVT